MQEPLFALCEVLPQEGQGLGTRRREIERSSNVRFSNRCCALNVSSVSAFLVHGQSLKKLRLWLRRVKKVDRKYETMHGQTFVPICGFSVRGKGPA